MVEKKESASNAEKLDHLTAFIGEVESSLSPEALREEERDEGHDPDQTIQRMKDLINKNLVASHHAPAAFLSEKREEISNAQASPRAATASLAPVRPEGPTRSTTGVPSQRTEPVATRYAPRLRYLALAAGFAGFMILGGWVLTWRQSVGLHEQLKTSNAQLSALAEENRQLRAPYDQARRERAPSPPPVQNLASQKPNAPLVSDAMAELQQKLDRVFKEKQKQAQTIREMGQKLEKYQHYLFLANVSAHRLSDPSEQPSVQVPLHTLVVDLQVELSSVFDYPKYRSVLKDSSQQEISRNEEVVKGADGTLHHIVDRKLLKPGEYRIEIYGMAENQEQKISTMAFQLVAGR